MTAGQDLLIALVSIPLLVVARFFALSIPYTNQGFFCDDDEIRYPDRPSTIGGDSMTMLYGLITIILVPLSEYSLIRRLQHRLEHFEYRKFKIHPFILKTLFFWASYTCGYLATSVATNIFKRTSSRLRPNFISICQPANLDTLCPLGSNAFVEDFTCMGESRADEHYSFPSSHASQSLFFAVYTILYLHHRLRLASIIRAFIQYGIFVLSIFICLSRVRDFKHRYVDVMGGGMLGITIAVGMIQLILFNFRPHRYRVAVVDSNSEVASIAKNSREPSPISSDYGSIV